VAYTAGLCNGSSKNNPDNGKGFPQDSTVPFEWMPVLPSNRISQALPGGVSRALPTVEEEQVQARGQLVQWYDPGSDIMAAHPFGRDLSMDIRLDARSARLNNRKDQSRFHAEVEQGLFPYEIFNGGPFGDGKPRAGDDVLLKGDFIVDCGHPPFSTEVHPPSFMAVARSLSYFPLKNPGAPRM
jgi:hypothetical protein